MATYLGTRLSNCTEVVDHVSLGHTDTRVADAKGLVLLVGGDADIEILPSVELGWVSERGITDFVEGIGSVGNQLSQENFLVRVESVYEGSLDGKESTRSYTH